MFRTSALAIVRATALSGIAAISLLHSPDAVAAPSIELARIEQGNWSWSVNSWGQDAPLYYYARGAWGTFKNACPALVSSEDDAAAEAFGAGWIHSRTTQSLINANWRVFFEDIGAAYGSSVQGVRNGQEGMRRYIQEVGCENARMRSISQNLARYVSGRRPVHSTAAYRPNLARSETRPMRSADQYFDEAIPMDQRAALLVERDMNQLGEMGLETLACYYDLDAASDYYRVQYHFKINLAGNLLISSPAGMMLVGNMQRQLFETNNRREVQHPIVRFGSPKFECPGRFDPALPSRDIFKPRQPGTGGTIAATNPDSLPPPRAQGRYQIYDLGVVSEDFAPAMPSNAESQRYVSIVMTKQAIGSLVDINVQPFSRSILFEDEDKYQNGTTQYRLAAEDLLGANQASLLILTCSYNSDRRGSNFFRRFWFADTYPRGLDPARLSARLRDHPLLYIHYPHRSCPATWDAAVAVDALDARARVGTPSFPVNEPLATPRQQAQPSAPGDGYRARVRSRRTRGNTPEK